MAQIVIEEQTAASVDTPDAGKISLFLDSGTGSLSTKDESGTVEEVGSGAGGGYTVATDPIWDASGDLAVGSGADTAAKLAIGTANQVLSVNSGGTALEWATPAAGGLTGNFTGNVYTTDNYSLYVGSSGNYITGDATTSSWKNALGYNAITVNASGSLTLGYGGYTTTINGDVSVDAGGGYGLSVNSGSDYTLTYGYYQVSAGTTEASLSYTNGSFKVYANSLSAGITDGAYFVNVDGSGVNVSIPGYSGYLYQTGTSLYIM